MHDERWIPCPQVENLEGSKSYNWKGLDVKFNEKGRGVYVTENESKGLRFPYGGAILDIDKYRLLDKDDSERMSYICIAKYDKNNKPILWLDAHPSLQPKRMPNNG